MKHTPHKAIALLSGGLDSTVATVIARREFDIGLAVTFDYGQRAAAREIETARSLCELLKIEQQVIALPWLAGTTKSALVDKKAAIPDVIPETLGPHDAENAKAVWVPNRNGVFIAIAASLAEARGCPAIVVGFNAEEAGTFPDNSAAFVESTNAALGLSTSNEIRVTSPVLFMTKPEIAAIFVKSGLASGSFWCCYDGGENLCGRCESCARTIRAFREIGEWEAIRGRFGR